MRFHCLEAVCNYHQVTNVPATSSIPPAPEPNMRTLHCLVCQNQPTCFHRVMNIVYGIATKSTKGLQIIEKTVYQKVNFYHGVPLI